MQKNPLQLGRRQIKIKYRRAEDCVPIQKFLLSFSFRIPRETMRNNNKPTNEYGIIPSPLHLVVGVVFLFLYLNYNKAAVASYLWAC